MERNSSNRLRKGSISFIVSGEKRARYLPDAGWTGFRCPHVQVVQAVQVVGVVRVVQSGPECLGCGDSAGLSGFCGCRCIPRWCCPCLSRGAACQMLSASKGEGPIPHSALPSIAVWCRADLPIGREWVLLPESSAAMERQDDQCSITPLEMDTQLKAEQQH